MRRREFVGLLGGGLYWPFGVQAQTVKMPTIGMLGASTVSNWAPWVAAFTQRLRELGWTEEHTVRIEYRWADGRSERFSEIAAEYVRIGVDVIVTVGGAAESAKSVTS